MTVPSGVPAFSAAFGGTAPFSRCAGITDTQAEQPVEQAGSRGARSPCASARFLGPVPPRVIRKRIGKGLSLWGLCRAPADVECRSRLSLRRYRTRGSSTTRASSIAPRAHAPGASCSTGFVAEGLIGEQNLVAQLARALSVPRYDPKERSPEPEALALIDPRAAEELGVLPVAVRGGGALLWVALCYSTDEQVIGEITRRTGRRVKACLIGPGGLERALQTISQGPGQQPPPPQQPAYPQQGQGMAPPQHGIPLPSGMGSVQPMGGGQYQQMPNMIPQGMQPMPGSQYPYGYPPQQAMPMQPPMQQPPMQQMMAQQLLNQQTMGMQTNYGSLGQVFPTGAPPARPGDTQRLEDELAQVKQVVKVLTQLLVERGALDGEELKRRLRAERERKS